MKKHLFVLPALLLVLLTSCSKEILKGSGDTVSETRFVPAFSSFLANGNRNVEILYAPSYKVELTGYENLISGYLVKVIDGRLSFEFANFKNVENDNISLRIYTPSLDSLFATENANVVLTSGYNPNKLLTSLDSNSVLRMASGQVGALVVTAGGSSKIFGESLVAKDASVIATGNATLEVRASEKASMKLSGNCIVQYWGNAALEDIRVQEQAQLIRR